MGSLCFNESSSFSVYKFFNFQDGEMKKVSLFVVFSVKDPKKYVKILVFRFL